jgi:hypothetical protein
MELRAKPTPSRPDTATDASPQLCLRTELKRGIFLTQQMLDAMGARL